MFPISTIASGTRLTHEIEIKRSRFIATLARTDSPDMARTVIDEVKRKHPQARHHCSAYLISGDGRAPYQHSSDDGEPAGTAGPPMLEALRAADTWNVTAVVARYFGGTLLGTGGLIRAYSSVVSEALAQAVKAELHSLAVLESHLSPADAGRIESELRAAGAHILQVDWGTDVAVRIGVETSKIPAFNELLASASQGSHTFHVAGHTIVEVDVRV